MVDFTGKSCKEFVQVLASKEPVPGGGGASALVGALGIALGNMVGSLTMGKKKYASVEEDISCMMEKATQLQEKLLELVTEDAVAFEPLSRAYGLPQSTEAEKLTKQTIMEQALKEAAAVPLKIMECCCQAIELHKEFGQKGSALAISDVGVGVACCRAALLGASLNVFINTKYMTDREYAKNLNAKADAMLNEYTPLADQIFEEVAVRFQQKEGV